MIDMAKGDPIYGPIHNAFVMFGAIFIVLSVIRFGYGIFWSVHNSRMLRDLPKG